MSSEITEEFSSFDGPPDLKTLIKQEPNNDLLSTRSKRLYQTAYKAFDKWRKAHTRTKSLSQSILLSYFNELSKKYKPTSLWCIYSMLKSTINLKENIDIGQYNQLTILLKKKSEGFKSRKTKVLMPGHIQKFLTEAPDYEYLAIKVALIFGVSGACRKNELVNVKVGDITKQGDLLVIRIPTTNIKKHRFFTICDEFSNIVKKYESSRPKNITTERFFLNYKNGRCTCQVIGVNQFAKMPRQIATYLNLPNPQFYTGHSFRSSSKTLLTNSGANITTFKCLGGWKSTAVAEGHTEESVPNEPRINNIIESDISSSPSTSRTEVIQDSETQQEKRKKTDIVITVEKSTSTDAKSSFNGPIFKFENCNVTIVHNYNEEKERPPK